MHLLSFYFIFWLILCYRLLAKKKGVIVYLVWAAKVKIWSSVVSGREFHDLGDKI